MTQWETRMEQWYAKFICKNIINVVTKHLILTPEGSFAPDGCKGMTFFIVPFSYLNWHQTQCPCKYLPISLNYVSDARRLYFKLKLTHVHNLSLCRALYMCGEDAVQPAVHPGSGCSVDQIQPRGKTGLEHIWSTHEGKGEIQFQ